MTMEEKDVDEDKKCANFMKCKTLLANSTKGEYLLIYKFPPYYKLHIVKSERKNFLRYHFCSKECLIEFLENKR